MSTIVSRGGLILLGEQTASTSASLDFANLLSSTYDNYLILISNLIPVSNAVDLLLRVSTDGSTFDSDIHYDYVQSRAEQSSVGGSGAKAAAAIRPAFSVGNASVGSSNLGVYGRVEVYNISSGLYPGFTFHCHYRASDAEPFVVVGGGSYNITTKITGVQFLFSTGNISSGTIRVYGIQK